MKKLAAIASAMLTASAAVPYIPHAAEEYNIRNIPHVTYSDAGLSEQEFIQNLNERGLDLDFNSDGKFDHFDCYVMYRYYDNSKQPLHYSCIPDDTDWMTDGMPEELRAKIAANADLDGNDEVDEAEKISVIRHFLLNCDIDTSIFEESTYMPYDDELGIPHGTTENMTDRIRVFIETLNSQSVFIGVNYLFLHKKLDEGNIDTDVNNDGKFDIADVLDFTIVTSGDPWISEQDPVTGYWSYKWSPDKTIALDQDTISRVKKISTFPEESAFSSYDQYSPSAFLEYLFKTEPVLPEYLDNNYYEQFHEGASYYEFGTMVQSYLDYMGLSDTPTPSLEEYAEHIRNNDIKEKQYIADVKSGKTAPPDLNFDGVVNGLDLHIADLFHGARVFGRTQEESQLTKEEYDNLAANFDCNQNGVSADDDDIFIINSYILQAVIERTRAMATDENGEFYSEYADALYRKEISRDENPDISDPFHLYDNSGIKYEFPSLEDHFESYTIRVATGMSQKPDIDGSGIIDELDKKYADSYATFLKTGKMGDTEIPEDVLERIKTNCDYTYDGNSGMLYDMQVASLYIEKYILLTEKDTSEDATIPYNTSEPGDNTEPEDTELTEKCPGDANCDTNVDMSDAVLIMQSLSNPSKYGIKGSSKQRITKQGKYNADIAGNDDGVTNSDALAVQRILLKLDTD